jgi:hypothetical protein
VTPEQLLREYVSRLNAGIDGGGWQAMAELLADDAELAFEGIPVGPFRGRDAVRAAYESAPPDDTFELLEVGGRPGGARAVYAWSRRPEVPGGALEADVDGGRITRLLVHYGDDGR